MANNIVSPSMPGVASPAISLPPFAVSTIDIIRSTSAQRWFRNSELVDLLENYQRYGFKCLPIPSQSPPVSGNVMIFNKNQVRRWRQDGHEWKKKPDGKNIKEHHEKLKVAGVDVINCCYAHHETWDGFHRRGYWMLNRPHIVLVHYLQQYKLDGNPTPNLLMSEISDPLQAYNKVLSPPLRTNRSVPYHYDDITSHDSNKQFQIPAQQPSSSSSSTRKAGQARASRDRKKVYVDALKQSIQSLAVQISELEIKKDLLPNDETKTFEEIRNFARNPGDPSLLSALDDWFETDLNVKSQSLQQISMVKSILLPGSQSQFALWGFNADKSSLWTSLMENELHIHPSQASGLTTNREESVRLRNELKTILDECSESEKMVDDYIKRYSELIKDIRDVFPVEMLALAISQSELVSNNQYQT